MAKILLWNSIAKRRRSISDTFYDNGLGALKGYLEGRGHSVEVVDWARDDFFQGLSPLLLAKLLRKIYTLLMAARNPLLKKLLGFLSIELQGIMGMIQGARLKKHLKALACQIKEKRIRIAGIKIWYGEAFKNAQYLARELRKVSPETILIAGGYHVTLYEEHVLKNSAFDLGVACEGEFALEAILGVINGHKEIWDKNKILEEIAELAGQGKIENLIYRVPSSSRGSEAAEAILKTKRKYGLANISKTIPRYELNENKVRIHVMIESLGCDWGKCSFCVHPYFYPHYSLRDADEIILEIQKMKKAGIGIFRFAGSDTPPAFGAKIAQKIIESKLKVIFGMGSRPIRGAEKSYNSLVTSYAALINGGLRAVFMGGESGNDLINQEVMNKGINFNDLVFTIKALRQAENIAGNKVYLSLALIFPAPLLGKVTLDEVENDNIRLLKETMPDSVMITPPGPFLHTRWNTERKMFGFDFDLKDLKTVMEYEYVLYKPPRLWPKLGVSLEGRPFKQLLAECGKFRERVEKELHISTDISDEHFLMFYAAGIKEKRDLKKIKLETMLDIVSCDYSITNELTRKINAYSERIAAGDPMALP